MLPSDAGIYTGKHSVSSANFIAFVISFRTEVHKMEQSTYVKTAVLHGRNVQQCQAELHIPLGNHTISYETVAWWV
jgi:hypothetical protein